MQLWACYIGRLNPLLCGHLIGMKPSTIMIQMLATNLLLPGINRFDLQISFIIGALMKRMELSLLTDQPVETVPLILTLQIGMQRLIYLISIDQLGV